MLSVIVPVVLVVTAALGFWLSSYRQTRNPGVRAMCAALAALDLGVLLGYLNVTGRTWHPLFAVLPLQLMQHIAVLTAAFYLKMFCLHLTSTPERVTVKARRARVVLVVALVALSTFYALGPWRMNMIEIRSTYGDQPWVTPYLAVYSAYFAWAMLDVLLMSRFARHIDRPYLRVGLRLLGAGSVGGLLYVVPRLAVSVAAALGLPLSPNAHTWGSSPVLVFSSIMLLMAGVLVPPLGARWEAWRFHARLHPLWAALTSVAPELVYDGDGHRRSPGDRLRIRVTEIRDVLIGPVHAYLDPQVTAAARDRAVRLGLTQPDAHVVAEAATIAVALEAKRRGMPPLTTTPIVIGEADDVAQLVRIADAATSPVVTDTVREFRNRHDHAH